MTRTGGPLGVVFVCTANICRSSYAHGRTRAAVGERLTLSSYGTHALVGQSMDPVMAQVLTERGGHPEGLISQQVTLGAVADADLVLTAEVGHRSWMLEDWPQLVSTVMTMGQFVDLCAGLDPDLKGQELLDHLRSHRSRPHRRHNVADPYRRGEAAAQSAADVLDAVVQTVVTRLT